MGETLKNSQKFFYRIFCCPEGGTSFTSFRTRGGGGVFTQPGYRSQEINISSSSSSRTAFFIFFSGLLPEDFFFPTAWHDAELGPFILWGGGGG